jgi:hypothetical protein
MMTNGALENLNAFGEFILEGQISTAGTNAGIKHLTWNDNDLQGAKQRAETADFKDYDDRLGLNASQP